MLASQNHVFGNSLEPKIAFCSCNWKPFEIKWSLQDIMSTSRWLSDDNSIESLSHHIYRIRLFHLINITNHSTCSITSQKAVMDFTSLRYWQLNRFACTANITDGSINRKYSLETLQQLFLCFIKRRLHLQWRLDILHLFIRRNSFKHKNFKRVVQFIFTTDESLMNFNSHHTSPWRITV